MKRAIGGKGLTSHIIGVSDPEPPITDPNYPRWQQRDHCTFNWIINNIESDLVNEVSQYAIAKDLWEGLAITYGSGRDPFQVYDLHRQSMTIRQGAMTLEVLWQKIQDLWISIDARDPIDHPTSIEKDNQKTQRMRVYQFLTALDERYEAVKKEIINKEPLLTPREAYAMNPPTSRHRHLPGTQPRIAKERKTRINCSVTTAEEENILTKRVFSSTVIQSAAVAAFGDRAAYAGGTAGNVGTQATENSGGNQTGGGREEGKAVAAVSAARVQQRGDESWSEGYPNRNDSWAWH
ncbi:hypothetical protein AAHA92_16334 [Salvia divinorum]|uniref:UBN2_3 domain-containing protein n=1 Tax=Salvia divinorum TaxID=28513 RepID=A0ABD1GV69_SALDI